jgi:hypothetical protein
MASFLAVFSARKALDDLGMEIPVIPKFSTGVAVFVESHVPDTSLLISCYFSHPEEFPYRIVPRSPCTSEILTRLTGLGTFVAMIPDFWQTNMR